MYLGYERLSHSTDQGAQEEKVMEETVYDLMEKLCPNIHQLNHYMPDALLPPKVACTYIGVSLSTLHRWRREGLGPRYILFYTKYYYEVRELHRWGPNASRLVDEQRIVPYIYR